MKQKISVVLSVLFISCILFCGCSKSNSQKGSNNSSYKTDAQEDSSVQEDVNAEGEQNSEDDMMQYLVYDATEIEINEDITTQIVDVGMAARSLVSPTGEYSRIKDFVITADGSLYQVSYEKVFSDGSHYRKVNTDMKCQKFIAGDDLDIGDYILTTDNKLYFINFNEQEPYLNPVYEPYNQLENRKDELVNYFFAGNDCDIQGDYTDYIYKFVGNKIYSWDGKEVHSFQTEENIISAIDNTIKTTKGYYRVRVEYNQEYAESVIDKKIYFDFCELQEIPDFAKADHNGWRVFIYGNKIMR